MKFPTKKLGPGQSARRPEGGEAYKCPWCGEPMQPHDGPWAVVHCVPCQRSVDLWYDEPQIMEAEVEPYKPQVVVLDAKTLEPIDLKSAWTGKREADG